MSLFRKQIVLIGGSKASKEELKAAYEVGKEIAENRYILVCGGKGGVMEAACRGAKENKGFTIGILPEDSPEDNLDNKYLDIIIPTGINSSRNYIVQNSGSAIIMIAGGFGTLSELGFALSNNKKVIALKSKWATIDKKIITAKNAKDAVQKAIK
jgi:uncharacterized protein (TIGR00725 family)